MILVKRFTKMRNKEDIQKEIDALESTLSERKKELEGCNLKPYDWTDKYRYEAKDNGDIDDYEFGQPANFCFDTPSKAERFSYKLKTLSVINNLKKSLGCNHEFTDGTENYAVYYNDNKKEWETYMCTPAAQESIIYFKRIEDALKVCDYLNEHHPNGWVG